MYNNNKNTGKGHPAQPLTAEEINAGFLVYTKSIDNPTNQLQVEEAIKWLYHERDTLPIILKTESPLQALLVGAFFLRGPDADRTKYAVAFDRFCHTVLGNLTDAILYSPSKGYSLSVPGTYELYTTFCDNYTRAIHSWILDVTSNPLKVKLAASSSLLSSVPSQIQLQKDATFYQDMFIDINRLNQSTVTELANSIRDIYFSFETRNNGNEKHPDMRIIERGMLDFQVPMARVAFLSDHIKHVSSFRTTTSIITLYRETTLFLSLPEVFIYSIKPRTVHLRSAGVTEINNFSNNTRSMSNLHNESGKAVEFYDGNGIYALNGVIMKPSYVTSKPVDISLEAVLRESNIDVRRELLRKIGMTRMVEKGRLIEESNGYKLYDMSQVLNDIIIHGDKRDGRGRRRVPYTYAPYLLMKNPSVADTWHLEGVGDDCHTVKQAINWRAGNTFIDWEPWQLS